MIALQQLDDPPGAARRHEALAGSSVSNTSPFVDPQRVCKLDLALYFVTVV